MNCKMNWIIINRSGIIYKHDECSISSRETERSWMLCMFDIRTVTWTWTGCKLIQHTPHKKIHFLIKNWESGKQDFEISCQSHRTQFLNACCLVLEACCLLPDACSPLAAWCLTTCQTHRRRPPPFVGGSGRCSSIKHQASSSKQASKQAIKPHGHFQVWVKS